MNSVGGHAGYKVFPGSMKDFLNMSFKIEETAPGQFHGSEDEMVLSVTIVYDDVRSPTEILRISSGGLFVKTGLLLRLGDQVELEFSYGGKLLVSCFAQVTRIEPQTGSDEEIGLGIRYLNMDAKSWLEIEKYVFQAPTLPPMKIPSGTTRPVSTSQRFRIINQETDRRITNLLAEIDVLQRELQHKYDELRDLMDGSERNH